jgi:integrase
MLDPTGLRVRAKKAKAPAQARNLLGLAKRLFGWAIDQRSYGLTVNPCANLRPTKIIGEKAPGERTLDDDELFALWRNAGRLGYPYREIYRLLMLTGLRLNEVADADWTEFDLTQRVWTMRTGKARAQVAPLTDDIIAIVQSLPRFNQGDYLFSSTFGAKPIWVGSGVKKRLDARMRITLRAVARRRGDGHLAYRPGRTTISAARSGRNFRG